MSLASNTKNSEGFVKSAYLAAEQMGAEMPEHKNLANLPTTVGTIETAPSLKGLKRALDNGTALTKYPVGTEIEDTYDGQSNPLIVAQYLDETNNSSYGGAVGVILVRKYATNPNMIFGVSTDYAQSYIKAFLDTTYLENSSDEVKNIISEISVKAGSSTVISKFFVMSGIEVGFVYNDGEGFFWDYWKQKTGLITADNSANSGRIMRDQNGTAQYVWSRSPFRSTGIWIVGTNGAVYGPGALDNHDYILPACFVAKGGSA